MHHQAVTEHRDVGSLARRARHLERNQVLAFRHRLLEHAIQALVLEEKDRVGVADRGQQQALRLVGARRDDDLQAWGRKAGLRSEEHTSELQSRFDLVCRLLLEKKKRKKI